MLLYGVVWVGDNVAVCWQGRLAGRPPAPRAEPVGLVAAQPDAALACNLWQIYAHQQAPPLLSLTVRAARQPAAQRASVSPPAALGMGRSGLAHRTAGRGCHPVRSAVVCVVDRYRQVGWGRPLLGAGALAPGTFAPRRQAVRLDWRVPVDREIGSGAGNGQSLGFWIRLLLPHQRLVCELHSSFFCISLFENGYGGTMQFNA